MDVLAPHPNLAKLREVCLRLPESCEIETWGDHPTFRAGKKIFAIWGHGYPDNGNRVTVTFKAGERQALYLEDPRFYMPAYVGHKGWVGLYMDGDNIESADATRGSPEGGTINWAEIAHLVTESYKMIALKRMIAALPGG